MGCSWIITALIIPSVFTLVSIRSLQTRHYLSFLHIVGVSSIIRNELYRWWPWKFVLAFFTNSLNQHMGFVQMSSRDLWHFLVLILNNIYRHLYLNRAYHAHFQLHFIPELYWNISAWFTVSKTKKKHCLFYTGPLCSPLVQPLSEIGHF